MSGEAMIPHVEVTTSLARLQEAIAAQSRWLEQNGSVLPDGEEDLLAARRMLADELVEEARKLNTGRESVLMRTQASTDENEPASSLRGGEKVRRITMKGAETFVSHRHKRDAAEPHIMSSIDITNAGGLETMMKKARDKKGLHEHEGNPDGPQPR
jgi:hypothetical protein